jgi:hypothetical protein
MRARFKIGAVVGAVALASSLALVPAVAETTVPVSGPTTLSMVNITVPGPVGPWQTCGPIANYCLTVPGITDLSVSASAVVTGPALPTVTLTSAPGCTGQVNVAAVVTPNLSTGYVSITVQYALADASGTAIPNSETTIVKSVPFNAGAPPVVVTECATEL